MFFFLPFYVTYYLGLYCKLFQHAVNSKNDLDVQYLTGWFCYRSYDDASRLLVLRLRSFRTYVISILLFR